MGIPFTPGIRCPEDFVLWWGSGQSPDLHFLGFFRLAWAPLRLIFTDAMDFEGPAHKFVSDPNGRSRSVHRGDASPHEILDVAPALAERA